MSQTDTKTRILNAAEKLFARDGFHHTSLRSMTEQAKVNLAAVNYHFGSKEALLQAVIERRLLPLNKLRNEKLSAELTAAEQANRRPKAGTLLRAFIEPTLDFRHSGAGAEAFIALIGRSMNEPDQTVRDCFLKLVMPTFQLLFTGMQKALPKLPANILLARLQFTLATMGHVMCSSDKPLLNHAASPQPLNDAELAQQLLQFTLAGLEAPQ